MNGVRHTLWALVLLAGTGAGASALSSFHSTVAEAYRHYRGAVFQLRTGNAMVAGFELERMAERQTRVQQHFG